MKSKYILSITRALKILNVNKQTIISCDEHMFLSLGTQMTV